MEAQIAEMIGRDEKSNDYRFYHLFSSLVFDKTKKELRFPILREIWESGVAVKRYLEYPCKSPATMIHVWKSLSEYLPQQTDSGLWEVSSSLKSDMICCRHILPM